MTTDLNIPSVVEEVRMQFDKYERAIVSNDVDALIEFFWHSDIVIRFGDKENLYGIDQIAAFRKNRSPVGLARELLNTVITTFGYDFATANTEFTRPSVRGRQSQTWVKLQGKWKIVSAHVSTIGN